MSQATCNVRLWVMEGAILEMQIWCDDPWPTDGTTLSGEEWLKLFIENNMVGEDVMEEFKVPDEACYQVIAKVTIWGSWSSGTEEWDEQIEVKEVKCHPVPIKYIKERFPDQT